MLLNENLQLAKSAKNDEFYTRLEDIAKEVQNYAGQFEGKIVYCNCDNPRSSMFWQYFHTNFEALKLKKLIATYYDTQGSEMWSYEGGDDTNMQAATITPLNGSGSFASDECLPPLKECDIVVTNPPFSLFRDYVQYLKAVGVLFLIIGSQNAMTYKDMFSWIKKDEIRVGCNGVTKFIQPNGEIKQFGNICWFTNLQVPQENKTIPLTKQYYGNEAEYPTYINYNAISVDKVSDIPNDYMGVMGVPITFLNKFDPKQFEILGADYEFAEKVDLPNGKKGTGRFYIKESDGSLKRLYSRVLIKRK